MLGFSDKILSAWKHFTDGADIGRNMFDTVDNGHIRLAENNIAVFAHQFYNEYLFTDIPHFVEMFNMKMQDTFQSGLGNGKNLAAVDVFAQQHAEVRRYSRIGRRIICQINQWQRGTGRNQQFVIGTIILNAENQCIRFRLINFINTSSRQCLREFIYDIRYNKSI